jgi:ATP-grasp ribosomal peptide maturase
VLVVTQPDDMTADLVVGELNARGVPVVRFDTADFPARLRVSAEAGGGTGITGTLACFGRSADLARIRSLYYRRPSAFSFPGLDQQDTRFSVLQARYGLGGILVALPGCVYVNHPHRIADAEFKPAQLAAAVESGMTVPATLITNEPTRAREFIGARPRSVYKALRLAEYDLDGAPASIWTEQVSADEIDERVSGTMHLFQEMVAKDYDLRVTATGKRLFAVRIDSPLTDWRSDYGLAEYQPVEVGEILARQIQVYLDYFGLASGCFDFAVSGDGGPVFLECNPNGQWAWLEAETGLPIAAGFAELLET